MPHENEFDKEFGELRKRRFWLLVRKPTPSERNGHEIEPVIKVGSRVKWRGRWWTVLSQNAAVGWTVQGTAPGLAGFKQTLTIKTRTEITDVRDPGRSNGFVRLTRSDWLKLKREKRV